MAREHERHASPGGSNDLRVLLGCVSTESRSTVMCKSATKLGRRCSPGFHDRRCLATSSRSFREPDHPHRRPGDDMPSMWDTNGRRCAHVCDGARSRSAAPGSRTSISPARNPGSLRLSLRRHRPGTTRGSPRAVIHSAVRTSHEPYQRIRRRAPCRLPTARCRARRSAPCTSRARTRAASRSFPLSGSWTPPRPKTRR
jgi:hypothetical protein